jgi:hypothetical protein
MLLIFLLCTLLSPGPSPLSAEPQFPEWRGSNVLLHGEWIASPIVAVGTVENIISYGEQNVDHLPWPMSPSVRRLYWCQGDFNVIAVVKGELNKTPRKYLWASSLAGCKLLPEDPHLVFSRFATRAWFLREEGQFLRPTFDGGTHGFIGLLAKWDDLPKLPARQRLGTLLLKPSANSDKIEDYAQYLFQVGDIACELLGKAECVTQIKRLTKLGSPVLEEAACSFLKGQLDEDCGSK